MRIWLGQYTQHYTHDKEVKIMGRQPFRQMKSDGTMEDAGGSASVTIGHRHYDKMTSTANGTNPVYLSAGNGGYYNLMTSMSWNNTTSYGWRLFPFYSFYGGDVSLASIQVATGVADCTFEVGIYESNSDGMPTDRILQLSFDASSAGTVDITVSPEVTLDADKVYWMLCARNGGSNSFRMWGTKNQGVMPPAEQRVNYFNVGWYVIGDTSAPSSITHSTISWTAEANLPLVTLKMEQD